MKHITVLELEDWLTSERIRPFYVERSFEDARCEIFLILYTSGSTGVSKLVKVTYSTFAAQDSFQILPTQGAPPTLLEFLKNIRLHVAIPLFHGAAYFYFFYAAYYGLTSVIVPTVPPITETVDKVLRHGVVQACCIAPSILVITRRFKVI